MGQDWTVWWHVFFWRGGPLGPSTFERFGDGKLISQQTNSKDIAGQSLGRCQGFSWWGELPSLLLFSSSSSSCSSCSASLSSKQKGRETSQSQHQRERCLWKWVKILTLVRRRWRILSVRILAGWPTQRRAIRWGMMFTWKLWSGNVNGDAADENMLQGKVDENMLQGTVDCTTMDWPSLVVSKTRTRLTHFARFYWRNIYFLKG